MKRISKSLKLVLGALAFCLLYLPVNGNNIQISNVALTGQNTLQNYYMVQFDISWENSWRTSTHESNYDAAWIFIKYTVKNEQDWQHANLNYVNGQSDGHIAPPGGTIRSASNNNSTGVGVFLFREADGIGDVNFQNVQLRWNYGTLGDNQAVEVSVHAVEMVYVPQGSFYLGDGMSDFGQFQQGTTGQPYLVSSEAQITLGGGGANSLGNSNAANQQYTDDFDDNTSQTLPTAFPKGYNAFYCMKYEISQDQYGEFLAHLSQSQRTERTEVIYVNNTNVYPIETGNHYAVPENPYRAMDYMNWADCAAYADWAGLRPMSEMEYEKACRGPQEAVAEEYAWGNDSWYLEGIYELSNEGKTNEMISNGIGKNVGNANSVSIYQGWGRPLRCGIFAASAENKTREETGATYWGIMEMTGNCYERIISVGNSQSRDFSGLHGDGVLTSSGNASFSVLLNWGFVSAVGVGFRNSEISQRYLINTTDSERNRSYGFRAVRTANH
ncbi:MAG: SUMF1/EgtB/PvdO family nonheme iron enzyme [Bacteroidota bacterium]